MVCRILLAFGFVKKLQVSVQFFSSVFWYLVFSMYFVVLTLFNKLKTLQNSCCFCLGMVQLKTINKYPFIFTSYLYVLSNLGLTNDLQLV